MARILLAEDDRAVAGLFTEWLEAEGHEVRIAPDGVDGFRSFAFGETPDLLVTDVMMPACDGEGLAGALAACRALCPVLVVTAYPAADATLRLRNEPNVIDVLTKPIARRAFRKAVRCGLQQAEASQMQTGQKEHSHEDSHRG